VWAPNIPGWDDYPLRDVIAQSMPPALEDVTVASDREASILGEAWRGAATGLNNAIFLAVGTGIGAGILVDGHVLHGAHGGAGAVGWMALDRPYRPEYAACGCLESHASGEGLAKVAAALINESESYRGMLRHRPALSARDVFDACQQGDELAHSVLHSAVEFWGAACANLVSIFDPEMIVFGGGVFGPAAQFLDDIAAQARRWAQPTAINHVRWATSQLGSSAALYGAAYLALQGRNNASPFTR
jgi:glucokinase